MSLLEKVSEFIPSSVKQNRLYSFVSKRYKDNEKDSVAGLYEDYSYGIKTFKDSHIGQRCFIIATGPSLNNTNLDLLKNEIIFGVNTLYKKGIETKYYVAHDSNIWRYNADEILKQPSTIFLAEGAGYKYLASDIRNNNVFPLHQGDSNSFSTDIVKDGIGVNASVVMVTLQIAYYMGFNKVYLVGCDSSNKGQHFHPIDENARITLKRKEDTWDRVMGQYELCKEYYEKVGRTIYNATVGGKLEVFERVKLEDVI